MFLRLPPVSPPRVLTVSNFERPRTVTTLAAVDCPQTHKSGHDPSNLGLEIHDCSLRHDRRFCSCCRRRQFLDVAAAFGASFAIFPLDPAVASLLQPHYMTVLNEVHAQKPDWYEELYASFMSTEMKSYEEEVRGYKSKLFSNFTGDVTKVLELGIGAGPNLKYYCNESMQVIGLDPNKMMERYAQKAAAAVGLPPENFKFVRAVGEAIPLADSSMDAVVGTLVLCSVGSLDQTLREIRRVLKPGGVYLFVEHVAAEDGTILKFLQNVFDPLQQAIVDGCHLTRSTELSIFNTGFSEVKLDKVALPHTSLISPHIYGIARK